MTDTTANQYAPPTAEVADVAPLVTGPLNLFSARGRIGRLRYLAYAMGSSIVFNLVITLLAAMLFGSILYSVVIVAAFVALLWFTIITGVKRCHDIDISGWWAATAIIPIIAFIWIFVPGSKGDNRFGPPPPPNTWGVRLLAWILPVVFVLGIVAAISIPAYKDYSDRARAAKVVAPPPAQP